MLRLLRAAAVVLCAIAAAPRPLAAQASADVQKLAREASQRLRLQTELPREPEKPRLTTFKLPPQILWLVVAGALGVLLYLMLPLLRARRVGGGEEAWSAENGVTGPQAVGPPAKALGAADELAAQGRFVDAMHVLLLQGLAEIRQRHHDQQFADSLTSREILRSARLSQAGRASLRDIIDRVEWTYFGEHPAVLVDYAACRSSFNVLAETLRARAPA
jgi:hypothetical protein